MVRRPITIGIDFFADYKQLFSLVRLDFAKTKEKFTSLWSCLGINIASRVTLRRVFLSVEFRFLMLRESFAIINYDNNIIAFDSLEECAASTSAQHQKWALINNYFRYMRKKSPASEAAALHHFVKSSRAIKCQWPRKFYSLPSSTTSYELREKSVELVVYLWWRTTSWSFSLSNIGFEPRLSEERREKIN